MSDKLFPDKQEYEYEEKNEEGLKERIKNLKDRLESLIPSRSGDDGVDDGFRAEDNLEKDYTSESTGFDIEREENKRGLVEKAGIPTYSIVGVEIILVTYLALALLGYVPMF